MLKGYPNKYIRDSEIENLPKIKVDMNNQIFHAGTYEKDKKIFSKGGRVLNITSMADKMIDAKNNSIDILKKLIGKMAFIEMI